MKVELGKHTLNEIRGQVQSFEGVRDSLKSYYPIIDQAFEQTPDLVIFTGCGTSYYLAASACSYFLMHNSTPAIHLTCFELYLHTESYIKGQKVLIIPFTRCSTTSEVAMTIKKCRTFKNVKSLAITCDEGSSEYNDWFLLSPNAHESSIVMTRSFSSMLYISMIMSLAVSGKQSKIDTLMAIPEKTSNVIQEIEAKAQKVAAMQENKTLFVSLGQGPCYGIAGEISVKVKEMVLLPTEVYYTLEYRHGPISIANEKTLFNFYCSKKSEPYDVNLMREVRNLGSSVMAIGEELSDEIKAEADFYFEIGKLNEEFDLLPLTALPGQFLGTYTAIARGLNPDIPRNLSKAVVI